MRPAFVPALSSLRRRARARRVRPSLALPLVALPLVVALLGAGSEAAGRGPARADARPAAPLRVQQDLSVSWNTFQGGDGFDVARDNAVDAAGYSYVVGDSAETWGSPVRPFSAVFDVYVAKLDPSGALLWNTFLGGTALDESRSVAVDDNGNVYVVGRSFTSWGSPVVSHPSGAFVAKLDPNGALLWHTFFPSSTGEGVAVDGAGNVYASGASLGTWGSPVRAYTAAFDAYVARLDPNGALLWNTFLGGAINDEGGRVALDDAGNLYLAGHSNASWGSPVRAYSTGDDAFVAKLDASGVLQWHSFLGGAGDEEGRGIAVDAGGDAHVVGEGDATWGSPIRAYGDRGDAFAARLDASGALLWNTFLGSDELDEGYGAALDSAGNLWVVGTSTVSWGNPVRPFAGGSFDAFAALLQPSGALFGNTFFGADSVDEGRGAAVDPADNAYVSGGSDRSWGSPVRPHGPNRDGFAVRLGDALIPPTPAPPTAARLLGFTAQAEPSGAVRLRWETASEAGVLGFALRRAPAEGGPFEALTARPIPARGSAAQGTRYELLDAPGPGRHHYRLEALQEGGEASTLGRAEASVALLRLFLPSLRVER